MESPAPARLRAYTLVNPYCPCGRILFIPRPFLPTDPPVTVSCSCGWTGLASLNLDWYIQQAVADALEAARG